MLTSQISEILANPSNQQFFVLDIDSTLVTTHQRNQAILESFIESFASEFAEDIQALKQAQCQPGDYGLRSCLERIQFEAADHECKRKLDEYWRQQFFSNTWLNRDLPAEKAVEWTQKLKAKGAEFVYLTARYKETMWDGTLSSLAELGFPISPDTLFLKEDRSVSDEAYKSLTMKHIEQRAGEKTIWFIDNEPVVLNQIDNDFPHVNLIWFKSTHSGRMTPPEGVPHITHFNY